MRSGSTIGDIRARNRRRVLRIGLAVAALAGVGWLGYDAGTGAGEARIEGLKRRIAELEAETRASGQTVEEIRAALDRAGRDVRVWRQRYEEEVPRDREAGLWQLVKRKLDERVALERLSGVIELVANERRCDAQLTARRIIVRTRLHGGSDTAAGFGQGRITVLGDGQRAHDAANNPHAWYDPDLPVTISFVTIGGATEKVVGFLPLHHSVLVGEDEFRFTVAEGTRSFASVTAQRCDYP